MKVRGDISGLEDYVREVEQHYISRLAEAGEAAIAEAVTKGKYQNITGNRHRCRYGIRLLRQLEGV